MNSWLAHHLSQGKTPWIPTSLSQKAECPHNLPHLSFLKCLHPSTASHWLQESSHHISTRSQYCNCTRAFDSSWFCPMLHTCCIKAFQRGAPACWFLRKDDNSHHDAVLVTLPCLCACAWSGPPSACFVMLKLCLVYHTVHAFLPMQPKWTLGHHLPSPPHSWLQGLLRRLCCLSVGRDAFAWIHLRAFF